MFSSHRLRIVMSVLVLLGTVGMVSIAYASHSWNGYHWARTANPFTLKLGDNVSSVWDGNLATASSDWSVSSVLDTTITTGTTDPRKCRAKSGRVEVCNAKYGNNGWLGIASVWVSGSHITQGTVKLNDTYFNTPTYNTIAWRNLVMCQEIAHAFGLDHQDEDFANAPLGTCMDYTSDPMPNQHPNQHDYDQLEMIYSHLDTFTTLKNTVVAGRGNDKNNEELSDFGKAIKKSRHGRNSHFEKDMGKGGKVFTFVVWAGDTHAE
ncbi:MAG: hypothetical protein AAB362_00755 [Patescibacteria group bacterium]